MHLQRRPGGVGRRHNPLGRRPQGTDGWQREEPASWVVEELLQEEPSRTMVQVEGRTVHLRAWRYDVKGVGGYTVPICFLDADLFSLRYALSIPREELWSAHAESKKRLMDFVNRETGAAMDENVLTIGFARRATPYKRADLLFRDMPRLKRISNEVGRIQVIYGGKAHPRDDEGKQLIKRIFRASHMEFLRRHQL